MVIKKSQAVKEQLTYGSLLDYPMPNNKIGISYQEHAGRAPKEGWGMNRECYELYFIISGTTEIYIDDTKEVAEAGDVVVIYPGQKSYMVSKQVVFITITTPNWTLDQYQEIV